MTSDTKLKFADTFQTVTENLIAVLLVLGWIVLLFTKTQVPDAYQVLAASVAGHSVGYRTGKKD